MPVQRRPPMPKLPPFALADQPTIPASHRPYYLLLFLLLFTLPLIALHSHLLTLPFFWDEQGQFIPTALDLLRHGWWVAHSTLPNVHPPGVEVYLVLWYKLFGFSIPVTRVAMLVFAGAGLLFTFLLAIELSRDADGAPAFLPPMLLLVSPLFYMQSMMAQLDMPAMVLTLAALLLFLQDRFIASACVCIALVLVKETGVIVPAVCGALLLVRKDFRAAPLFVPAGLALLLWLTALHSQTGFWLGNPEFAHYNVAYALQPVRLVFSIARRIYYLFFAEFRWIGTLIIFAAVRRSKIFWSRSWRITLLVSVVTLLLVSLLGGAELERYLLPVLPVFYIAVSVGITQLGKWASVTATAALLVGLIVNLFWNPPYPFPYENNYAMVDFVKLQQAAAAFTELNYPHQTIATAWPFSAALRNPDYGYVKHGLKVIETGDFHTSSIDALAPQSYSILITYTRTWMPKQGVIALPFVRKFLTRFYEWAPDITPADCEVKGLSPHADWLRRGQEITVYVRDGIRR